MKLDHFPNGKPCFFPYRNGGLGQGKGNDRGSMLGGFIFRDGNQTLDEVCNFSTPGFSAGVVKQRRQFQPKYMAKD